MIKMKLTTIGYRLLFEKLKPFPLKISGCAPAINIILDGCAGSGIGLFGYRYCYLFNITKPISDLLKKGSV